MSSTRKGQSVVEYSILLIIVMIVILVMGPYLIRSVNAHLKTWDDSVDDSMSDPLTEADVPAP